MRQSTPLERWIVTAVALEQVRPTAQPSSTPAGGRILQRCRGRQCSPGTCAHEDDRPILQRRSSGGGKVSSVPPIVHEVLRSPGHSLDLATRTFMESRFGHDFSQVRVHTDASAAASGEAMNALAYTAGSHIVFGPGRFAPRQRDGLHLLAHELTHTIQQGPGSDSISASAASLRVADPHGGDELEADRTAAAVVDGQLVRRPQPGTSTLLHRAVCPSTPTRLGDTPVEPGRECEDAAATVTGQRFLFCTDSDQLTDAGEAELMALIPMLRLQETVEIHGFASPEGPAGRQVAYNLNLSCHRVNRVAELLEAGGVPPSRIHRYRHGGTSRYGSARQNRAVVIPLAEAPFSPDLVRTRFRVAALNFLACAPCNPFTDDGALALSPPATEPPVGSSYRMKHWMEVEVATADRLHMDPSSPGLVDWGHSPGESGYCGTKSKAHVLAALGPVGRGGSMDAVHGETWEWESEFVTQVGAVVPCTLPDAPCGPLGPSPMIPPIRNRFRLRVFADGTKESEFVSSSTMPNHYLYEDGKLKTFGGVPVHPRLDFKAWATSTGVSLREAEIGFAALREACCNKGKLPGCICTCSNGKTDVVSDLPFLMNPQDNFMACLGVGAGLLMKGCPTTCAPAGTACTLPTWSSNP